MSRCIRHKQKHRTEYVCYMFGSNYENVYCQSHMNRVNSKNGNGKALRSKKDAFQWIIMVVPLNFTRVLSISSDIINRSGIFLWIIE